MTRRLLPQGAEVVAGGIRYRVWAPGRTRVVVEVVDRDHRRLREVVLEHGAEGYHEAIDPVGAAGDLYKYDLGEGASYPCPASRWQPLGLNGPSLVVDPTTYRWRDAAWKRPLFRELVVYELHVGAFTPEGSFRSAIAKLPHLRDLGVTALELMPIPDFPGARNWGYDGVRLYAPAHAYGSPDELRALVDAAHAHGLAVILDVVFNHLGPEGNYLRRFSDEYFEGRHHTPWGEAMNFGGAHSGPVRDYFVSNVIYWMEEFHLDGFRLDATHQIFDDSPRHILAELADAVHQRGGYLIAEDERNEARLVSEKASGGYGLDAIWADDFHHVVEVATIDASTYRGDFAGEMHELAALLAHGWLYRGQVSPRTGKPHGTPCEQLSPERFVFCISNHDQVGNRAFGERLHHLVSPETYRAASALLCLLPYTPLLFAGQEWAASAPFLYFTDHHEELGRAVEEGRRREFEGQFATAGAKGTPIPSPQAPDTFLRSKLDWSETARAPHAACLELYCELLALRRSSPAFRPAERGTMRVAELGAGVLAVRLSAPGEEWLLLCDLRGGQGGGLEEDQFCAPPAGQRWRAILSSNETRFGGSSAASFNEVSCRVTFALPEVVVLQAGA